MTRLFRPSLLPELWQRVPITMVTTALLIAGWTYRHFSASSGAMLRSHASAHDTVPSASNPLPATPSSIQPASATHARVSAFRRVWVAPNEIDYIAEDVTIRILRPIPKSRSVRRRNKPVNIGDEVTIHYFAGQESLAETVAQSLAISK
jgi:hypothetical protein